MERILGPILVALVIVILVALVLMMTAERYRVQGVSMLNTLHTVMPAYRRGDYETALEATEGFRLGGDATAAFYCFFRGYILAHLGRLDEAEGWLRRNIAMREREKSEGKQNRHLAIGHTSLGNLMLQAGRFDEAEECFQASISCVPERGSPYRGMAELCLLGRGSPAEALRLAKLAIAREQTDSHISHEVRKLNLGEDIAMLAWATAADSHNASEVALWVTEAVKVVGATNVLSTAQVHYHSGRAYAELGDLPNAANHYEEAARLDLQGHWGRAARAALKDSA